jgi:hypothetical protein
MDYFLKPGVLLAFRTIIIIAFALVSLCKKIWE